jgi:tetratricopeptide (TPR) repeat protein
MFWKILEFMAKIIYAKRVRQAAEVGAAARLASDGDPEAALEQLDKLERKLHKAVRSFHSLTRGRILLSIGRTKEAEAAVIAAARFDPANLHAHFDLAVMSGKSFRLDDAGARLTQIVEEAEDELLEQARDVLSLVARIQSGEYEKELRIRAEEMAHKPIGPNKETAGLPADMELIDKWAKTKPEEAKKAFDEIALLVGQTYVEQGGKWRINLSLEDSVVECADGTEVCPFDLVSKRFRL